MGRSGQERRGQADRRQGLDRRNENAHVQFERRIGFDRRAFRERRSGPNRREDSQLGLGSPVEVQQPDPTPAEEMSFAARLRELTRLDLAEPEAERHWKAIARNRKILGDRLGRDAGQEVAALDYFLNINPRLTQPALIESSTLVSFERDAMTDALTGLFNRRYFEAGLRREVERCRRYGAKTSLLMLDLDRFKATNDHYGHQTGDLALKTVGRSSRAASGRWTSPAATGGTSSRLCCRARIAAVPGSPPSGSAWTSAATSWSGRSPGRRWA